MANVEHFEAVVIGSGQGGTPLCQELAKAGMKTALIEAKHIGGTCINEGCTPTKTMVASGRVAYLARRGADYGVQTGDLRIDMERVRERKREIVKGWSSASEARIEKAANLELIFGEARFTGPKMLQVRLREGGERAIAAERIFINAGARPAVPKIEGVETVPFLNSTSIMELDAVPEHLVVLGGGYVGLEFGQLFRRLGSRVTLVQSAKQLLPREDADVADEIAKILREDGIEVLLNARAERVSKAGAQVAVDVRIKGDLRVVSGAHLLVATGRVPNSDTLNLGAAGIVTDPRGNIRVNDKLETNVPGVYALGDITGEPAFTHISYDDFRILRTNVIERGNSSTIGRLVPYTVFIDPQLGRIGLSEAEARSQGRKIRVAKMPMSFVARAVETDEARGFMKAVVDAVTEQILGAAVLGIDGGDIMAMLQLAMMGGLPFTRLRDGVFAHPTLAESLNNLFGHFEEEERVAAA